MFDRFNIDYLKEELLQSADDAFDSLDWSIEPIETFKELCKQRALQLRNTYDYIILHFSGGSDSTTVLNSFLDNNIPIDEIVTKKFIGVDYPCLDGKKAILDLKEKGYRGKFTEINLTYEKIIEILKNDNKILSTPNWTGQLHGFARFSVQHLEKLQFIKSIKRIGNICNLTGEQEPFVVKKNNEFYAKLLLKRKFIQSNHYSMTPFFTSTEFPKLHVKQCHIIAKFYNKNPNIKMTERIKKMLVRDCYCHWISPVKCRDNPDFTEKNINVYTEPSLILKSYTNHDDQFENLYKNSILNETHKITNKIKIITEKYDRYYKLFDSTETLDPNTILPKTFSSL